jgi:dihydroxyacetone kinase phosphoprotein-dependent L subunit
MSDGAEAVSQPDALRVTERVVRCIAQTAVDNEANFSALDSVVGDGDFGFSLARGFEKVLAEFDTLDRSNVGTFLKKVAVIITSRCGGTSGPIWGTAFLRAGGAAAEFQEQEIGPAQVVLMLRAAFNGIAQRGGASLGDKTLLDSLGPFIDCFEREAVSGATPPLLALERASEVADHAARATSELVAKRGRASYTGERSRGSVDPGATAVAVIARSLCGALRDGG